MVFCSSSKTQLISDRMAKSRITMSALLSDVDVLLLHQMNHSSSEEYVQHKVLPPHNRKFKKIIHHLTTVIQKQKKKHKIKKQALYMPNHEDNLEALKDAMKSGNSDAVERILSQDFTTSKAMTAKNMYGRNCLMIMSSFSSMSEELTNQVCNKSIELDNGNRQGLLNAILTATDLDGNTCLRILIGASSSAQTIKLIAKKLVDVGGPELLNNQLTEKNALLLACDRSTTSEVIEFICEKVVEVGGSEVLKRQLSSGCLLALCDNYSLDKDMLQLVFEKLVEVGGLELLRTELADKKCFAVCSTSSSSEAITLFATMLAHFDVFKEQYESLRDFNKKKLNQKTSIDSASWTPDEESVADVKEMLQRAEERRNKQNSNNNIKKKAADDAVDAITIKSATMRKYFDFFDHEKTGLMEKSSVCAAIVASFPMASTIGITERVQAKKCKETNQGELDFDDFCSIVKDVL